MTALRSFFALTKTDLQYELAQNFEESKAEERARLIFTQWYAPGRVRKQQLSANVKQWVDRTFDFNLAGVFASIHHSALDGSVKFIVKLHKDGQSVETVLIPEQGRLTLCLSSQVGCAQGCRFCHTGRMGLVRNLKTEEILTQVIPVQQWIFDNDYFQVHGPLSNIVFMGMGEPLDNLSAVQKTIEIVCDPHGLFLSHNRVTVSTVGLLPALETLLAETKAAVAISLHSPFEHQRSQLMPVNLRHPMVDILDVLKRSLENKTRKSFLIQYILLHEVNDSLEHAEALHVLLKEMPVKINLIPLNEHTGTRFTRPTVQAVRQFQKHLKDKGHVATVRFSKGRDIQAACGQLIHKRSLRLVDENFIPQTSGNP